MSANYDPQREPAAAMRAAARALREMFVALVREGFTERQALAVIGQVLASQQPPPPDEGTQ